MKRHITTLALGAALAIGAAQVATAESASSSSSGSAAQTQTIKSTQFRASKIIGSTVYDRDNRDIGSVKEIVVDHDGRVADVVVGVGGFLGVGEKNVAVPLNSIKMENDRLTLDRTKGQLQEAANYQLDRDTSSGSSTDSSARNANANRPAGSTGTPSSSTMGGAAH